MDLEQQQQLKQTEELIVEMLDFLECKKYTYFKINFREKK